MTQYFDGEATGGGGAVDSVNGQTGVVVLTKSSVGLGNVNNTSDLDKPISTATQTALDGKQDEIAVSNGQVIYQESPGNITGFPGLFASGSDGLTSGITLNPNGESGGAGHGGFTININPISNTPDYAWNLHNFSANIDTDDDGFSFGTNGECLRLIGNTISHVNKSNIGGVAFISNYFNLGNGTDAFSVRGIAYSYGFGEVNANVTVDGPIQGYGFQPNLEVGSATTSNCYINAFYDFSNMDVPVNNYQSFAASPQIAKINNNKNYTGVNLNPTIDEFDGNANFLGLSVAGNFTNFGTGQYYGLNINSTVGDVVNAFGAYINMNNVTATGSKYALFTEGNVQINGSLAFSGGLSIGQLNAFAAQELSDGGGTPASVHFLISQPFIGDNETIANADIIGVNTAALITIGANSAITTAFLGIAALGLPAVVNMAAGSTVDRVSGATFALSLDAGAGGGTIAELALCRATAIPNGITAVTNCIGYKFDFPFGFSATNTWGLYADVDCPNYMEGSLIVGTSDQPTNSSVGIEIDSTTKALLLSRMTTTERNALTAVNGMVIYNTTDSKVQAYAGGSWVDLH